MIEKKRLRQKKKVAIIGGAGHMGEWLVKYFTRKGLPTSISDSNIEGAKKIAKITGAELAYTNRQAVEGADIVIISVPLKTTNEIILEVAPHMNSGSILVEISSLKKNIIPVLRSVASSHGIQPLSIHPMFGPVDNGLEDKTIIVIPVKNKDKEKKITRNLFEEASIVLEELDTHDRAMSISLSLTYFMNIVFARILARENLLSLKKLSGTTFTIQLALTESIVNEHPILTDSLLGSNEFTINYIDRFISEAKELKEVLKESDIKATLESLKSYFKDDKDFQHADERRFKAYTALRK
jgi:prephenate dehydrogenase